MRSRLGWTLMALGVVALGAAYVLWVFSVRAQTSDLSIETYVRQFLPYLGLEPSKGFRELLERRDTVSALASLMVLAVSYISHSFATMAAIVDEPVSSSRLLFTHLADILGKLGWHDPRSHDWILSGRLPSLPGALWHQAGVTGLIIGALLLGAAATVAEQALRRFPASILTVGIFVLVQTILLLSPAVFAPDLLAYPFVALSFVYLALIDEFIKRWQSRA